MKRIVLALLALLGLVAQAAPVSARLGGMDAAQVGVVLGARTQGQGLGARAAILAIVPARPHVRTGEGVVSPIGRASPIAVPTVRLRVDRARE